MSRRCGGREAMTATEPKYEPAWLQGDDVFDTFEAAGIDPPAAVEWLSGAHHDRGLALADDAEPSRDLFRLPWGASLDNNVPGFGDFVGRIDWHDLTVIALYSGYHVPVPIEVSRVLLAELLPKSTGGKSKGGRKPYDRQAIEKRVGELMDHHGDFSTDDPDWNTDARLVEKLEDELGISRTTLYETIPPMVDAWRRSKSGN
jgi:hypothetical protein